MSRLYHKALKDKRTWS